MSTFSENGPQFSQKKVTRIAEQVALNTHGNAPFHKSRVFQVAITERAFKMLFSPRYKPDFVPSGFTSRKKQPKRTRFDDVNTLQSATNEMTFFLFFSRYQKRCTQIRQVHECEGGLS